jgi:hypothetical protein
MTYTLSKPKVDAATIAPNPVDQNKQFLIQISVSEIEIILEPTVIYCGTFYCGEDGEI